MKKFIIGIGIPGAGKTTHLKAFAEKYGYTYICADDVRSDMEISLDDPRVKSPDRNPLTIGMWDEIRKRTRDALNRGETVVLDATFTKLDLRQEFIRLARECGPLKIQGVFLDLPSEEAWRRVNKRERQVPREVFDQRVEWLRNEPPQVSDGFDSVFNINEYENTLKAETKTGEREQSYKNEFKIK